MTTHTSRTPHAEAVAPAASSFDDQLTTRLLHQRIVVLGTAVDDAVANRLCAQLLLLSAEDPRADVALYVNSPGGSVSAGLAIYDTMRLVPNDVSTVAMGFAASMGQFLLCAGTPGKRFALPHARIMMHQPSAGIGGTAVDIAIQAEEILRIRSETEEVLSRHTGQTVERLRADTDRDLVLTARQAVEYGVADAVVTSRKLAAAA